MKGVLPSWAVAGAQVARRPYGRLCRITKVSPGMALVHEAGHSTWVSAKTLSEKWRPAGPDPLQELLRRMKDVHPDDLAPSLRDLRKAWLEAGCPGLEAS